MSARVCVGCTGCVVGETVSCVWLQLSVFVWVCTRDLCKNVFSSFAYIRVPSVACVFVCLCKCVRVCMYACISVRVSVRECMCASMWGVCVSAHVCESPCVRSLTPPPQSPHGSGHHLGQSPRAARGCRPVRVEKFERVVR